MKLSHKLAIAIALSCPLPATAGELLFADNFDAPDTDNLDLSDQAGRRSGLNPNIQVRSSRIQHGIVGNQLNFLNTNSGRVRFHEDLDNDNTTAEFWQDWASGEVGEQILEEGGFRIEFDWIAGNNTSLNWVSANVGISDEGAGEPATRVNNVETDIGILFRYNGDTELFTNGTNLGAQGTFEPTIGSRHIVIDYFFNSFEDDTTVTMIASVDGTEVYSGSEFFWNNNFGELYIEIGTLENTLIDNLRISGVESGYESVITSRNFLSSAGMGTSIGGFSARNGPDAVPSTFGLVAGAGATDNAKFQIVGDELQVGTFDFLNEPDGTQYSVRVAANSNTGGLRVEQVYLLTLTADADADSIPDSWEIEKAGNTTDLNGLATGPGPGAGSGDFDGDTLSDLSEYELDTTTHPGINPTLADTDGDELGDGEEFDGVGSRPATNPVIADSDGDALSDGQESNTGTFAGETDTGSNPVIADTDADGYRDGFEVLRGGDPTDFDSTPPLSPPVSLKVLTDSASTGIDSDKTYTHAISAGGITTINGVDFDDFGPATGVPDNIAWDTGGLAMDEIIAINFGDWVPEFGGVDDIDLQDLFGGFTYSSNGANSGAFQTFTLSGLTPGQEYLLSIYIRLWDTEGSGRAIDLSFANGAQVAYAPLLEDRPAIVLGDPDLVDAAYAVEFSYTASGEELVITAAVPAGSDAVNGSFHFYGLANEVVGEVSVGSEPVGVTAVSYDSSVPKFSITFDSTPGTNYALDFTTNLEAGGDPGDWSNLFDVIESQGDSTTVEDVQVPGTGASRVFYRVRKLE